MFSINVANTYEGSILVHHLYLPSMAFVLLTIDVALGTLTVSLTKVDVDLVGHSQSQTWSSNQP